MTWHRRLSPRYGPPRVVRRAGFMFALLILFAAIAGSVRGVVAVVVALAIVAAAFVFTIRRLARHFAEQDRLRRQLMADVAHELRTPLAILQGRIEGLLDGVYPRDDARLGELLSETQHLSRLVEDVRTLANAEAGALDLRKEAVDIAELIRDAAKAFDAAVDVADDLPHIDADPIRIREVLLNLLANATQHGGRVRLSAEARANRVVIQVHDDGPGIPADELAHVFDRFRKGSHSQGSGLGLSIAQKLVAAHGGEIHIESGDGTTVTVSLPR